jgi:hypothetical protein
VRPHPLPILVAVLVVLAAAAAIWAMAPRFTRTAAGAPASVTPTAPASAVWSSIATATPDETVSVGPTPAFASFRGVQLLLPVPVDAVTAIAFHQSSFKDTYKMKPLVAIRSVSNVKAAVKAEKAGGEPAWPRAETDANESGVWTGSALEVWRTNVGGAMDSCADCGAPPGSAVFSPVSGTVMRIRSYKLYGSIPDYEFHIKPDAWNDVDVILLHVTDPAVAEGDRVEAGVTQIASVRNLTSKISGMQLRSYTIEGGNHTHMQLTKIPKPNQTWVVGQDPPGFVRRGD